LGTGFPGTEPPTGNCRKNEREGRKEKVGKEKKEKKKVEKIAEKRIKVRREWMGMDADEWE
jgi:hypothetical protein